MGEELYKPIQLDEASKAAKYMDCRIAYRFQAGHAASLSVAEVSRDTATS